MSVNYKYNYSQIARDSGFKLQQFRNGVLDWRLIGCLDVDKIFREQQFEKIDDALPYLSEAPLAPALEINVLDSSVGKYFFISQLAIQYLIFCRQFLDQSVTTLRESFLKVEMENKNLRALNQEHKDQIIQLHKKVNQLESISDIVFPCHICTKNFVSNDDLNIHLSKKHSNTPNDIQIMNNDRTLINTIKLELEIKYLKERLNLTEKCIREASEHKLSPRKSKTISRSTQFNIENVDRGTQCNLFEAKEADSSNENDTKLFISELQEKIRVLESWKAINSVENNETLADVNNILKEINESLCSKYEQDFNKLKQLIQDSLSALKSSKETIPTFSEEFQHFLSSTVSDIMQQNSKQINEILNKIDTLYDVKESYDSKNDKEAKNAKEILIEPLSMVEVTSNNIALNDFNHKTYFTESQSSKQHSESTLGNAENGTSLRDTDVDNVVINKALQTLLINDMLDQKLAPFGIAKNTKTISSYETENILSNLVKNRSNMQKVVNPKFITTRNKLKKILNKVSSPSRLKPYNIGVCENSLKYFQSHFTNMRSPTAKGAESTESDSFKERIERILSSPIKKPSYYSVSPTTNTAKPVPLPRKRIMFQQITSSNDV